MLPAAAPPAPDPLGRYRSLQAALDLIDQGFTLIDAELRLLAWNQAFIGLLDFPPALAREGAPFEDFIRYNAERGDYGPGDAGRQVAERMAAARRFEPHEFERTRPNGQVLHVRGVPVPGIGFITLYSDVTEARRAEEQIRRHAAELERHVAERTADLQRSEARLRLITDSIPALIAYFDARKAYTYINRGYQEWFGLDPAHPERVSARQYLGEATYMGIRPNVARALAGEPVSYEYEATTLGGVRTARTTLIPERAGDGSVLGCFELTFDVSELRRAQQMLSQAEKMEALGQLTGGIAHDFNNMLTVILGNLGALREARGGSAEMAEFVDPALAAARRGAELIRALLSFARNQPLEPRATDVATLAGTVLKLLRRSLPGNLQMHLQAGVEPLAAWVDPSQLQDALVNLVLNARDARASEIRVGARSVALDAEEAAAHQVAPGRYVCLEIADDGHGMDEATRSRVFEPFFTTKRPGAGTGLGLAMVYGFVRQSGGAIDLRSALQRGTTVSIWLPQAAAGHDEDGAGDDEADAPAAAQALALLVEDDADVRQVVRRSLVDLGYAVLEAASGDEALQILAHTPDIALVLSDVVMPGTADGREVARRAQACGVPRVALMSGHVPGAETGGLPLLRKPFGKRQLAEFLRGGSDG